MTIQIHTDYQAAAVRVDWNWIEYRLGTREVGAIGFWQERRNSAFEQYMKRMRPFLLNKLLEPIPTRSPQIILHGVNPSPTVVYYQPYVPALPNSAPAPIQSDFFTEEKEYDTDWETNYEYDRIEALNEIFDDLARLRYFTQDVPTQRASFSTDLGFLSDRVLTSLLYLCLRNDVQTINNLSNGEIVTNFFFRKSASDAVLSISGRRLGSAQITAAGGFGEELLDCEVEITTSTGVLLSISRIMRIDTASNPNRAILDRASANQVGCSVVIRKSLYQIATVLMNSLGDEIADNPENRILMESIQEVAVYINNSEYEPHTILWSQVRPDVVTDNPQSHHCTIYTIDFDSSPALVTTPSSNIPVGDGGNPEAFTPQDVVYTSKMIALQDEIYGQTEASIITFPTPELNHAERLLQAARLVRFHRAITSDGRMNYSASLEGPHYSFTWSNYFGFAWVNSDSITEFDEEDDRFPMTRPLEPLSYGLGDAQTRNYRLIPAIPDDFSIDETNYELGPTDRNYAWSATAGNNVMTHSGGVLGAGGITWHWLAGWTFKAGGNALIGPQGGGASAHYNVGLKFWNIYHGRVNPPNSWLHYDYMEGIGKWVDPDRRSEHSGKLTKRGIDGSDAGPPYDDNDWKKTKGSRNTIGIETTGHMKDNLPTAADFDDHRYLDENWPWKQIISHAHGTKYITGIHGEQLAMCIFLARDIISTYDGIEVRNHHGHYDLVPTNKTDPIGFPYARVLRAIYPDQIVPDIWSEFWPTLSSRENALSQLGYSPTNVGANPWNDNGTYANELETFKTDRNAVNSVDKRVDHFWCTFTCWEIHDARLAGWRRPNV